MADRTISELEAVSIEDLPGLDTLLDEDLLAVSHQQVASKMTGLQWKAYAQAATAAQVEAAANSAQAAGESAKEAQEAQQAAQGSADFAKEQADKAEQYSGKPPIIQGDKQTWYTWDAESQVYQDTGKPSRGNLLYASFWVDPENGKLYMITDQEYNGPQFRLNMNMLEVVINAPANRDIT